MDWNWIEVSGEVANKDKELGKSDGLGVGITWFGDCFWVGILS